MKVSKPGVYRMGGGSLVNIHYVGDIAAGRINNGPRLLWDKDTGKPIAPRPRSEQRVADLTITDRIPTIGDRVKDI